MLKPLSRDDVPKGLVFSLGYAIEPGSRLILLRSSDARDTAVTSGDFLTQSRASLTYVRDVAAAVDPAARIVKVRRHMTSSWGHRTPEARNVWVEAFGDDLPASTALEVPGSPLLHSVVDLECWAVAPARDDVDPLERRRGDRLTPDAVAVRGDQKVALAAVQPDAHATLEAELRSCLSKIEGEFDRHGATPADLASLTVYFRDPRAWRVIEGMIFGRYGTDSPVVNPVVVSNLQAQGRHVEMTGFALARSAGQSEASATIDLSDQLLATTGTGAIHIFTGGNAEDMYRQPAPGTIEEQAHVGLANQQKVLESAGASFDDVVQSTWYVTDMRDWAAIEPIATSHFGRPLPVPMVVEVARLTAKQGVRFEPDLWAVLKP